MRIWAFRMTRSGVGYASSLCRAFVGPLAVVFLGAPAAAQDFSAFEQALTDCVKYVTVRPQGEISFLGNAQAPDIDDAGVSGTVLYPVTAGGGTWDYAISYEYEVGNSITPPDWTCGGSGDVAPTWPMFSTVGWISADARIRAGGLVELNFPGGPKGYANCTAQVPDVFIILSPSTGDRVVFAAITGPAAQAYCTSLGVKG
jgi:hypothetical protein